MNLEKLLAENLLRFGVKNLDNPIGYHVKFLMEQDPRAALNQIENDAAAYAEYQKFQKDAKSQYKNVTLIKTQKLVPINQKPLTVTDYFYNNFVTLELGVKDPKTIKAKLDGIIDKLKTAGANMDDPKTVIEIVSTATSPFAGTGPATRDFPNGVPATHKKLDHTYGGQLVYDKTGAVTAESKLWAKTNGNNFLAQQRGESAKKYLESKGVKASIIVIALTDQPTREFQITANQTGTEKVINPIGVPDIEWSYSVSVDVIMASAATNTITGNQVPHLRIRAGGNLGSMKNMIPRDSSNDSQAKAKVKVWSQGGNIQTAVSTAKLGGVRPNFSNFEGALQLQPSSLAAHIADKLQLIFDEHKKYTADETREDIFNLSFKANGSGNLQDLVNAAAAAGLQGVSTTKSTDPAYWQNAYFFDYTTKNAQGLPVYGKLNAQNAAAFFAGATFQ